MKIVQLMRSIATALGATERVEDGDRDCPLLSPTHNTGDRAATVVLLLSEDGQMQRQWRLNGRSEDRDRAHCEQFALYAK